MQLAATTYTPRVLAMDGTPELNRIVGSARIRVFDKDDHVTFTTHQQFVTGGVLGAREGYDTLRSAMAALRDLTRGEDHAAAVIVERDGRFLGRVLKGRDLEQGFRAPLVPMYLEDDDRMRVVRLETNDRYQSVRAIVDGDWARRFQAR